MTEGPKPTFTFTLRHTILAPALEAFKLYYDPRNLETLHPFTRNVRITKQAANEVAWTATDKLQTCCFVFAAPLSASMTLRERDENNVVIDFTGTAPTVRVWGVTRFEQDPSVSNRCTVEEVYYTKCPVVFKGFTQSRARSSHTAMWENLKREAERAAGTLVA